nr:hypothetical protein [Tanacetum cinerariifolium]
MIIDQQVAMDEALVPHAFRLRIRRSNFHLLSNISSKESTLQLVYDVLRLSPFFKAFLVTADVLEIYMQEFWATATVHHYSIRFKMDNKKHIVNLESFREMLHICPRLPGQTFDEPPFEEEILAFLQSLGHAGEIKRLTDVEHKDTKKSNEMYYPRFTKMFTTIKLVSRHQNTQQFGAILPIELTNADIRNSDTYKEYYAVAAGATPPKTKASIQKTMSGSDTTVTPPPTAVNIDFAYLLWEDFVYQVEHKDAKKSNEMYYPSLGMNVGGEEGQEAEDDDEELYRDVNINLEGRDVQMADVHITQEFKDTHVTLTSVNPDGQQQSSSVSSQ